MLLYNSVYTDLYVKLPLRSMGESEPQLGYKVQTWRTWVHLAPCWGTVWLCRVVHHCTGSHVGRSLACCRGGFYHSALQTWLKKQRFKVKLWWVSYDETL